MLAPKTAEVSRLSAIRQQPVRLESAIPRLAGSSEKEPEQLRLLARELGESPGFAVRTLATDALQSFGTRQVDGHLCRSLEAFPKMHSSLKLGLIASVMMVIPTFANAQLGGLGSLLSGSSSSASSSGIEAEVSGVADIC